MSARCSLPDCHRGAACRGLCVYHYKVARRQGRLADYPLARHTPAVVVPWTRPPGPLDRPQPPYCGRCGCTNGLHWAGCDHAPGTNTRAVGWGTANAGRACDPTGVLDIANPEREDSAMPDGHDSNTDPAVTNAPHRVQLKRTKGWRLPPNTVVVSRPSKWGNPFKVGELIQWPSGAWRKRTHEQAVEQFRRLAINWCWRPEELAELRGKNLACWCPLDQPCHADVLLELANAEGDK